MVNVRQEVGAADELHREEGIDVLGHHELVKPYEIRVMNVGEGSELPLEGVERPRVFTAPNRLRAPCTEQ
jgi:hypothetical protein